MATNPALERMGYAPDDRLLIFHADDIGMCQSTLPALANMLEFGLVSSAATMVPCPWFPAAAEFCRAHPGVDMGVHLTLNCEWRSFRWGPISTADPASGLIDAEGYFYAAPADTIAHADEAAVAQELGAQVRRALAAGIDATHLDAHMGTPASPRFAPTHLALAQEHRLPAFFSRYHGDWFPELRPTLDQLATEERLLIDNVLMLPLDNPNEQVALAKRMVSDLQPGITVLIFHPAVDSPELRAIAPDWASRVANYHVGLSIELREHIRKSGVKLVGYRPLRDMLRAA